MNRSGNPPPFWLDEIELLPYSSPILNPNRIGNLLLIYRIIFLLFVLSAGFTLLYLIIHPIMAWAYVALLAWSSGVGIYRRRIWQQNNREIAQLQEQAKQKTGAIALGSARHVAGHPALEREQPVVLALIEAKELLILDYQGRRLDLLPLGEIVDLHTVTYDDERIAHIEAVDATAQALQITFLRDGITFTALFRSMKKPRPIDWYHLLQKSRLGRTG